MGARRGRIPVRWEATQRLLALPNITWFSVEAENFESIHNHSAYALIKRDKTIE